jgi:addiction module HigA family antidote
MPMKAPPHPGLSVRLDCLEPVGLSVTEAARALGVTRQALNNVVNGKAGISPDMAIRLDKAFGGTAEAWLALQTAYDLAEARKRARGMSIQRFKAPRASQQSTAG